MTKEVTTQTKNKESASVQLTVTQTEEVEVGTTEETESNGPFSTPISGDLEQ